MCVFVHVRGRIDGPFTFGSEVAPWGACSRALQKRMNHFENPDLRQYEGGRCLMGRTWCVDDALWMRCIWFRYNLLGIACNNGIYESAAVNLRGAWRRNNKFRWLNETNNKINHFLARGAANVANGFWMVFGINDLHKVEPSGTCSSLY